FYSDRSKEILVFAPDELSNRREDWVPRIHPDDVHLGRIAMAEHIAGNKPFSTPKGSRSGWLEFTRTLAKAGTASGPCARARSATAGCFWRIPTRCGF